MCSLKMLFRCSVVLLSLRSPFCVLASMTIRAFIQLLTPCLSIARVCVCVQTATVITAREALLDVLPHRITQSGDERMAFLSKIVAAEQDILNDSDPFAPLRQRQHDSETVSGFVPKKHASSYIVRLAAATLAAVECCSKLLQRFGDVATLQQRVYLEKLQVRRPAVP